MLLYNFSFYCLPVFYDFCLGSFFSKSSIYIREYLYMAVNVICNKVFDIAQ